MASNASVGPASDEKKRSPARDVAVTFVRGPLVSSTSALNNEATPAIGVAYLMGYLERAGYEPKFVDAIAEGFDRLWTLDGVDSFRCQGLRHADVAERIPADSEVIAFSCMFSGEWPVHRALIAEVRRAFPRALIVAGGEHVTALSEYCLRDCPALDACVRGEGEAAMLALVDAVARGEDPRAVPALGYLDSQGTYRENGPVNRLRDISHLPWPSWPDGYLEKFWDAGKSFGVQSMRDMPAMLSRGCPYRCTFCSSPSMWTTRYVLRDVDDVIAEIRHNVERHDITAVQLYDLTAITKKKWIVEFCRRLIDEGLRLNWSLPSGTRSEALDAETLTLLRDSGCNYLVYAPESGSPRTLERIKKRINLKFFESSVRQAKWLGIVLRTNLIMGFPHETRRDLLRTGLFGLKLAAIGVDEVSINIYSPYPGSELFRELLAEGRIRIDDAYFMSLTSLNSDYTHLNPISFNGSMSSRELAFYRIGFMLANYAISYVFYPWRIVRTLKNVFSSHDAATVLEHRLKDAMRRPAAAKTDRTAAEKTAKVA